MASTFARRAALVLAGGGVYVGASGLVYLYLTTSRKDKEETDKVLLDCKKKLGNENFSFVTNPERAEKFDEIAAKYDLLINTDELFMGMPLLRRSLLYWHAHGTVLEVAAGTGRNCSYYPKKSVDRVLLMDSSKRMLDQARPKVMKLQANSDKPQFAFLHGDSAKLVFSDNTFDTVVDTFGLCSFDDPIAVLKELERVCKPEGKILLLEHGRSKTWDWIAKYLDQNAERHARNWGSVWNRDLDHMIEESGLQLERIHTWHFGTTYYMVCKPNKKHVSFEQTNLTPTTISNVK